MKKILLGLLLGTSFTMLATVSPGEKITSDLINKILDIKVSSVENNFSFIFDITNDSLESTSNGEVSHCDQPNNRVKCYFDPVLQQNPSCVVNYTRDSINSSESWALSTVGNNHVQAYSANGSGNGFGGKLFVVCQKQGLDYKAHKTIRDHLIEAGFTFL